MERIIVLVDMDCFYVQVEQRANPSLKGKPCAVVQYNTWKGGGIIAVGYEARAKGVTRQMRGDDAKAKCPEIILVRVPEVRGKADLSRYREAGAEVIEVFSKFSNCVERASIDEAYIDLTEEVKKRMASMGEDKVTEDNLPNTHATGFEVKSEDKEKSAIRQEGINNWLQNIYESEELSDADRRLAVGAVIVEEMRAAVYEETGFRCSAGIAHNKVLAKLACGVNKPNKQTVLPHASVTGFFQTMPIGKVRGFGGKFGYAIKEILQVEYMAELQQFSLKKLQDCFGSKSGPWVHDICRGLEYESVSARQLPKSIGCSKNFRGKEKLDTREKVKHWLLTLAKEVVDRLEKDREQNKRKAKSLIIGLRQDLGKESLYFSRSCAIVKCDVQKFADDAHILLSKFNRASSNQLFWDPPLLNLSMVATKFTDTAPEGSNSITSFLTQETVPLSQAVAQSQVPTELSLLGEKSKKITKAKGIELFFSQPSCSSKSPNLNASGSKMIELEFSQRNNDAVQSANITESAASPKLSFFQNYRQKKSANFELETESGRSNSTLTVENNHPEAFNMPGCSHAINENSVDDFDLPVKPFKEQVNVDIENVYDVDTDYSDDEVGNCKMRCDLVNKVDSESVESNFEIEVAEESIGNIGSTSEQESHSALNNETDKVEKRTDPQIEISDDMMTCEECGESVLIWEFPEHSDFHFAMKLQQETKKEQRPLTLDNLDNSSVKRKDVSPSSGRGRKRAKLNGSNMKTLHTFFKS